MPTEPESGASDSDRSDESDDRCERGPGDVDHRFPREGDCDAAPTGRNSDRAEPPSPVVQESLDLIETV
jgi:hypothetical protein